MLSQEFWEKQVGTPSDQAMRLGNKRGPQPWASSKAIFSLQGYFNFLRLFLKVLENTL